MSELNVESFPIKSLKPKCETRATQFIQKYPNYDGRNVIIAVLDSGVDPKSSGLTHLPDGEVKVIERYDCSGAGDVETTKVVKPIDDAIVGLSGRSLKLTAQMKAQNLSGEYRVGLKSLHDLYPTRVREKILSDKKTKSWDEFNKKAQANIARDMTEFESKNTNLQNLSFKDKLAKENIDGVTEFLNSYDKKYSEIKTSFDCILFNSNEGWFAVIDLSESGDLEKALVIREYSKHHEVKNIDEFLSISINVHDDGNVLEIVGMCSSHGTHVASIACGYHPENAELNGVAPAAKVVSLTIGDGRLGSMETGTALVRAIIKVMELCESGTKIDVINMSYGEHAHWSNSGRIGDLMSEVVNKYGVVWVASAGNHGPALGTIGTPPDLASPCCVGVGAYVSPEMMEAEYVLSQKLQGNAYTWSSRDPCIDGGFGVTVCAPGAAIASVPEFTMSKAQLMNGTSMAAPHVAGSLALVISGLKQTQVAYTPFSIKRALWNTATHLPNVDYFAQGNGLLNVEKLFEHLQQFKNLPENQVRFAIGVSNGHKGIHVRHGHLTKPEEFNVTVEPLMFNEKLAPSTDKINFNLRLTLVASEPWVQCGSFIDLCYSSRAFNVKIDPSNMAPGVHSARIRAYDSTCVEKGTLFEVPITVVQPVVIDNAKFEYKNAVDKCRPNTIIRDFILVPKNATYAILEMVSGDPNNKVGGKFLVHTMQLLPAKYCKALETQKILPVVSETTTSHPFKCVGENILEVCIAKYWSNFGEMPLRYKIKFRGVQSNNALIMHSANGVHRLDVTSLLTEEMAPTISLKSSVVLLKPQDSKILPLTKRDVIPKERQIFNNVLTYNLHLVKAQEVSLHAPLFSSVLYESEFESQLWMCFDVNKQMVACCDAYSNSTYFKLDKGDYVIKLQIRHERRELLEKASEAVLVATFKLPNTLGLEFFKSYNNAVTGSKKISSIPMQSGLVKPLYVAPMLNEKITKNAVAQSAWLEGVISFPKEEFGRKVDTHVFQYILTEGSVAKKTNGNKETKSKLDEYKEGLRDFQNSMISKLDLDDAESVYQDVLSTNPTYLAAHMSMLQNLDTSSDLKTQLPFAFRSSLKISASELTELKAKLTRMLELSDLVIQGTNQEALLAYYGLKTDNRLDAAKIKTQMDKQKQLLLEAFVKKAVLMGKLHLIEHGIVKKGESGDATSNLEEFDNLLLDISKYMDLFDAKILMASVWHAFLSHHPGRMLKYLQKMYEDKLQRDILEEIQQVVLEKEWSHISEAISKIIVTANPQNYRMF